MNKNQILTNEEEIINEIKSTIERIKKIPHDIRNRKNIKDLFFKLIQRSGKKDITEIEDKIKNSEDIKNLVVILKEETKGGNETEEIKNLFDNLNAFFDDVNKLREELKKQTTQHPNPLTADTVKYKESQIIKIDNLFCKFKDLIEVTKEYTQKTIQNGPNILQEEVNELLLSIKKSAKENNKLFTELVKLDSHIQDNNKILNELGSSANETKKGNGVTFNDDIKVHKYDPNKPPYQTNKPSNDSKIKLFLNLIGRNKGEGKVAPLPSSTEGDFSNIGEEGKKSSKKQTEKGLSNASFIKKLFAKRKKPYKISPL